MASEFTEIEIVSSQGSSHSAYLPSTSIHQMHRDDIIEQVSEQEAVGSVCITSSFQGDNELSEILGDPGFQYAGTDIAGSSAEDNSDEEDYEDDDIPVSYENALILNETYRSRLLEMIEMLEDAYSKNKFRQEQIDQEIDELTNEGITRKESQGASMARKMFVFATPYFKDISGYGPPPNEDTKKKRTMREIDPYSTNLRPMSTAEKEKLFQAVRDEAISKRLQDVVKEETDLLNRYRLLNPVDDLEAREAMTNRLKKLQRIEEEVKQMSDESLMGDIDKNYDWMKISSMGLDGVYSPESCRQMWITTLHPSINTTGWVKEEDEKLLDLINPSVKPQDWDLIAHKLNTGRTAFQCFHRFVNKFAKIATQRRWTKEEDKRLTHLVEHCRITNHVPWTKVAFYMPGRTKEQCYQRWKISVQNQIRRGRYIPLEDFILIIGVYVFEEQYSKIVNYLPNRLSVQLSPRFTLFLSCDYSPWSFEEDRCLAELIRKYGTAKWTQIAKEMPSNKNRSQCRSRFKYFIQQQQLNPKFNLHQIDYSESNRNRLNQLKTQQAILYSLEKKLKERFGLQYECNQRTERSVGTIFYTIKEHNIQRSELLLFMDEMKAELSGKLAKKRSTVALSTRKNLGLLPQPKRVQYTSYKYRNPIEVLKGGRKCFSGAWNKNREIRYSKTDEKITKFFRPSHPKRNGRTRKNYSKEEIRKIGKMMAKYAEILNFQPNSQFQPKSEIDSQNAIWKSFEEQALVLKKSSQTPQTQPVSLAPIAPVAPAPIVRALPSAALGAAPDASFLPVVRTYSRKTAKLVPLHAAAPAVVTAVVTTVQPEDIASNSSQECIQLIPPNSKSLIGLKGLLLLLKKLERDSGNEGSDVNPRLSIKTGIRQSRQVLRDPPASGSSVCDSEQKLKLSEADRLLNERFISLFFWPGHMSIQNPVAATKIFEGEFSAASNPLNVDEIIDQTKSKVQRRVIVKRSLSPIEAVEPSTSHQEPTSNVVPPFKKRSFMEYS